MLHVQDACTISTKPRALGVSAPRCAGGRAGRLPRELCRVRHARGAGSAAGRGRAWQRRGKAGRAGCAWVPACAGRDAGVRGAPRGRRRRRRRRQQGRLIQPSPRRAGGRFALAARGAPAAAAAHGSQAGQCSRAPRFSLPGPAGARGGDAGTGAEHAPACAHMLSSEAAALAPGLPRCVLAWNRLG